MRLSPLLSSTSSSVIRMMSSSLSTPPVSPYGTLEGSLFQYSKNLVAFESSTGANLPPKKCILLGGLSDGLLPTPYASLLHDVLDDEWSLVQPIISSSYLGFGNGNLSRDTKELGYVFWRREAMSGCLITTTFSLYPLLVSFYAIFSVIAMPKRSAL